MKILFVIVSLLLSASVIAQPGQSLTADDINARVQSQNDTTYIVNFWATWCSPCLKELPAFDTLATTTKNEKVKIMLVSVDYKTQLPALEKFLQKNKVGNEVFLLAGSSEQEYIDKIDKTWSGAIPATLMVKNGKRKFFEKDFTYPDLLKEYHNIQ